MEITYEGYGPGGVAVIVETATDNKNRTVAEIRHIFSKHGGTMGESGSVAWMFERRGIITLLREKYGDEDTVMNLALEAGADDVQNVGEAWEIYTALSGFNAVREALENAGVSMESAALGMVPKTTMAVDAETGRKLLRLGEALEDNDDVQNVYFNFELPDDFEPDE
jgi:YebC/PmpR family DNA-binding regulatory protein